RSCFSIPSLGRGAVGVRKGREGFIKLRIVVKPLPAPPRGRESHDPVLLKAVIVFLLQIHSLMLIRYLHMFKTMLLQGIAEMLLHLILAMHQEQRFYFSRILAGDKMQQVFIITVGAHGFYGAHLRPYIKLFAVNT